MGKGDLSFVRRVGPRKAMEGIALHVTSEAGNPSVPSGQGTRAAEGGKIEQHPPLTWSIHD